MNHWVNSSTKTGAFLLGCCCAALSSLPHRASPEQTHSPLCYLQSPLRTRIKTQTRAPCTQTKMPFSKLSHNAKKAWRKATRGRVNASNRDICLVEVKVAASAVSGTASLDERLELSVSPVISSFTTTGSDVTGNEDAPKSPALSFITTETNATSGSETCDSSDVPSACRLSLSGDSDSTAPSSCFMEKSASPSLRSESSSVRQNSTHHIEIAGSPSDEPRSRPPSFLNNVHLDVASLLKQRLTHHASGLIGTVRAEKREYDRYFDRMGNPLPAAAASLCSSARSSADWPVGTPIYDEPGLLKRRLYLCLARDHDEAVLDSYYDGECPHVCQSLREGRPAHPVLYKNRARLNTSVCEVENARSADPIANVEPDSLSYMPRRVGRFFGLLVFRGYEQKIDVDDFRTLGDTEYCPSFSYFPPGSAISGREPMYCSRADRQHPLDVVVVRDPLRAIPIGGRFEDRPDWDIVRSSYAVCA